METTTEILECLLIGDSEVTPEEKELIHDAAAQLAALIEHK